MSPFRNFLILSILLDTIRKQNFVRKTVDPAQMSRERSGVDICADVLCGRGQCRIITPTLFSGRHASYRRADTPVIPIAHKVPPYHRFQFLCRVIFGLPISAVKQLFFHSRPHTLTASVVVTPSAGTVHTLPYTKLSYCGTVFFACVLTSPVGMNDRTA